MTEKLAEQAWMVRVEIMESASHPVVVYFAVGKSGSEEVVTAVRSYPGIEPEDKVTATHPLTATEIKSLRIRADEVRTYG
jgi:hypothetical protein